jgi:hypothetical protein
MKAFPILTTPLFDRLLAKLVPRHQELPDIFESATLLTFGTIGGYRQLRKTPVRLYSDPSQMTTRRRPRVS